MCVVWIQKKHILVDLEQFENKIQPPYVVSNYF